MERSFKAQMKYADKLKIPYVLIIGEKELENDKIRIRNMKLGEEIEMKFYVEKVIEIIE